MKYRCSCGRETDELVSYFGKATGMRITVCDKCAEELGLINNEHYYRVLYKELMNDQKKTPEPDAN